MAKGKVLIFVEKDYEDKELWYPHLRLQEEGFEVEIASKEAGKVYFGKHGLEVASDLTFSEVEIGGYLGIIIPGGWAPDKLRQYPEVITLVQEADKKDLMIGAICHGGQVLVSAKIVDGRRLTSYRAVKDDLEFAGAVWVDEPVVKDKNLVTSRVPNDLPQFMPVVIETLSSIKPA